VFRHRETTRTGFRPRAGVTSGRGFFRRKELGRVAGPPLFGHCRGSLTMNFLGEVYASSSTILCRRDFMKVRAFGPDERGPAQPCFSAELRRGATRVDHDAGGAFGESHTFELSARTFQRSHVSPKAGALPLGRM